MRPVWFKRTIVRPVTDFEREAVRHVQRILNCDVTGEMDETTISHIRGFQLLFGLRTTGMLDDPTAERIESTRTYGSV